jgi:MazG family protein
MPRTSKKPPLQDLVAKYIEIVRRLRRECPWDREQTHQSIRHSLIEEAYEVVEAIDQNDLEELKKELGDLLYHIALHAVMAEEQKHFSLGDVIDDSMAKLIRRHPHVFGDAKLKDAKEVKANWEKLKMKEGRESLLDGIPRELPALLHAHRLQEKASKVGFDWKQKEEVWKKVKEEIEELHASERSGISDELEEEYGDLLFALVNYARFLHLNAEHALRKANEKFARRFREIERELRQRGRRVEESTLEEMDRIWNEGKHKEKRPS